MISNQDGLLPAATYRLRPLSHAAVEMFSAGEADVRVRPPRVVARLWPLRRRGALILRMVPGCDSSLALTARLQEQSEKVRREGQQLGAPLAGFSKLEYGCWPRLPAHD